MTHIGEPVRKITVVPLNNPIPETTEPAPKRIPIKEPEKVPEKEPA